MALVFNPFTGTFDFTVIGADPMAQYLLLAGRAGVTNNPTISSSTTGSIYGSSIGGQGLSLFGNSSDVGGGFIRLVGTTVSLIKGSLTWTNATSFTNTLKISDGQSFFGLYTWPLTQGTDNLTLHTDSTGQLSWALVNLVTDVSGTLPDQFLQEIYIKAIGSIPLLADWDVGAHKITGLLGPTASQDAATKSYVDQVRGQQGVPGLDGADGEDSFLRGPQGTQGIAGLTGPQGIPGIALDGEDGGDSYIPGAVGDKGAPGPPGPQGIPGIGLDGLDGEENYIPGPRGISGSTGATGPAGPPGLSGIDGEDGRDSDIPGPRGASGINGAVGPQGIPGIGLDGLDAEEVHIPGPQGLAGSQGPTGMTGPPGMDSEGGGDEGIIQIIQGSRLVFTLPVTVDPESIDTRVNTGNLAGATRASNVTAWVYGDSGGLNLGPQSDLLDRVIVNAYPLADGSVDLELHAADFETDGPLKGVYNVAFVAN